MIRRGSKHLLLWWLSVWPSNAPLELFCIGGRIMALLPPWHPVAAVAALLEWLFTSDRFVVFVALECMFLDAILSLSSEKPLSLRLGLLACNSAMQWDVLCWQDTGGDSLRETFTLVLSFKLKIWVSRLANFHCFQGNDNILNQIDINIWTAILPLVVRLWDWWSWSFT